MLAIKETLTSLQYLVLKLVQCKHAQYKGKSYLELRMTQLYYMHQRKHDKRKSNTM